VAKVELHGVQQEQIKLKYDVDQFAAYGLTPNQLADILTKQNIVTSGGEIVFGQERLAISPSGNYSSVAGLKSTLITLPNSRQTVRLDDLVTISSDYQFPVNKPISFNGKPAVNVAVAMKDGGNNVRLGAQVDQYIKAFSRQLPIGIDIDKVNDAPSEVKLKVAQFSTSLLQSMLVVGAVMLLFLGWRTGIIVSLLIPVSMLLTLLVMANIGVGLDQISLAALIIALGMLVDNGIVMSENILVRINQGLDKTAAAIASANELKLPLLTSSLTTSAAFLPIYLAKSNMGEYTGALFVVVSITLLASWLLSLTLIPLLCVLLLKSTELKPRALEPNESNQNQPGISVWYPKFLTSCIRFRWITVAAMVFAMVLSLQGLKLLPNIFFPPAERDFFKMEITLPIGTAIEQTQSVVADVEKQLAKLQGQGSGIKSWAVYIGYGGPRYILPHSPRTSSPEYSFWVINTHDYRQNPELMSQIEAYISENHPDAIATARLIENGSAILNPVEIRINGLNEELVLDITSQLKAQLATINGLKDISDNWGQKSKKLNIVIDQQKANYAGVSNQDIAVSLQTTLDGKTLSEFRDGILSIPIVLTNHEQHQLDVERLMALPIYTPSGRITLADIAKVEIQWHNANVYRRNSYKTVTVGAQLVPGFTASQGLNSILPWLESNYSDWPNGTFYEIGGEFEKSKQSSGTLGDNLPLALFIIIALLVAQFNSFRKPLIILVTIPIAFVGVVAGLLIGNSFFGFMTLLGVVSLAGIVINNAIVLLEQVDSELGENKRALDALVSAGQRRMKPILLTTLTTVLGLFPLLISGGAMWQTMAIAIIAGLIFSTLLTLIFVPVLYSILYRVEV
jgi:multidrug efflux pump subunit AcrB